MCTSGVQQRLANVLSVEARTVRLSSWPRCCPRTFGRHAGRCIRLYRRQFVNLRSLGGMRACACACVPSRLQPSELILTSRAFIHVLKQHRSFFNSPISSAAHRVLLSSKDIGRGLLAYRSMAFTTEFSHLYLKSSFDTCKEIICCWRPRAPNGAEGL